MAYWKKNDPVATCLCPYKGCTLTANVFKYKPRTDDSTRKRFAGQMYGKCSKHGKFECTDYILESESTTWLNDQRSEAPAAEPNAEKTAAGAVQPAEASASTSTRSSALSTKRKPAEEKSQAAAASRSQQVKKPSTWGWL